MVPWQGAHGARQCGAPEPVGSPLASPLSYEGLSHALEQPRRLGVDFAVPAACGLRHFFSLFCDLSSLQAGLQEEEDPAGAEGPTP